MHVCVLANVHAAHASKGQARDNVCVLLLLSREMSHAGDVHTACCSDSDSGWSDVELDDVAAIKFRAVTPPWQRGAERQQLSLQLQQRIAVSAAAAMGELLQAGLADWGQGLGGLGCAWDSSSNDNRAKLKEVRRVIFSKGLYECKCSGGEPVSVEWGTLTAKHTLQSRAGGCGRYSIHRFMRHSCLQACENQVGMKVSAAAAHAAAVWEDGHTTGGILSLQPERRFFVMLPAEAVHIAIDCTLCTCVVMLQLKHRRICRKPDPVVLSAPAVAAAATAGLLADPLGGADADGAASGPNQGATAAADADGDDEGQGTAAAALPQQVVEALLLERYSSKYTRLGLPHKMPGRERWLRMKMAAAAAAADVGYEEDVQEEGEEQCGAGQGSGVDGGSTAAAGQPAGADLMTTAPAATAVVV